MMNYLKNKTSEPATYNRINVEISEMKQMNMKKMRTKNQRYQTNLKKKQAEKVNNKVTWKRIEKQ